MNLDFIKNHKKTAASVAAAIVLGAGAGVYFSSSDNGDEEIDWSSLILDVPTINVPTINVPSLDIVKLDVPKISIDTIDDVDLPNIDEYKVDRDAIRVIADGISFDNISIDELNADKITINMIELDKIALPFLIDLILKETISIDSVNLDKYSIPKEDLTDWIAFRKVVKNIFTDKRMLDYDSSIAFTNKNIMNWLDIYAEYADAAPIKYVEPTRFKMITEVRPMTTVSHKEKLDANLEFYKSKGYDSVLVTFYPEDSVSSIVNTVKYIKANHNMKVWLAYSGEESLKTSVFCDVNFYKQVLTSVAPFLDGYLNSWRRTSAHLWEQDAPFKAFTNITLRNTNPNLPIVGELYFGNYWKKEGDGNTGFVENRSANESGVCVMNFGFSNVNIKYLVNGIIKPYIRSTPLIGCVVGSRGYYASRNKNGLTAEQNIMVKQRIEQEFIAAGFIGTITFQDDGFSTTTNNLCETLYNEVTGK